MRLLYIARHFHPRMEGIVAAMAATGEVDVTLICPSNWRDELGLDRPVWRTETVYTRIEVPMLGTPNDYHRALYRTATFALRTTLPQIIHAEEEPESLAALQIAATRAVAAPHAKLVLNSWQNLNRPKRWYVLLVTQLALRSADGITCGNIGALAVLRQLGYKGLAEVIPQKGVSLTLYRPQTPVPGPNHGLRLLYAGRLLHEKDIVTLLRAMPLVSTSTTLRIVGDGPERAKIIEMIDLLRLSTRVTVEPSVEPTALLDIFAAADALILPSKTMPFWSEQLGRILLEAMACALPVIGSDSGAIPEVVGDAGLIFPEGNSQALADRIRELEISPARRLELGNLGRDRVQSYSEESLALRNIEFYRHVLARRRRAPML